MKKRVVLLIVLSVVLISFSLFIFVNYTLKSDKGEKEWINENAVSEIIDGDTFKLWNREIVRLICVDAPEKGKEGAEEAKEFLSFLILNKEIRMEKDVTDKDEYGRALRYVYVNITSDEQEENKEIFVNKEIVKQGYAVVFRYGNDTKRCGEIEGSG